MQKSKYSPGYDDLNEYGTIIRYTLLDVGAASARLERSLWVEETLE